MEKINNKLIEKQILYSFEVWADYIINYELRRIGSWQRIGLLSINKSYRPVSTDAIWDIVTDIDHISFNLIYFSFFKSNL